ncbi:MAG: primosomal protein N', partial [Chloroflexota bacterium]
GSGKTEIYLRAVAETLAQGRQAIVLVPEIALTPQTIRRFAERFPQQVTVVHSKLGIGERFDQWRRMRAGEVSVVVGSRSAIFAPLPRLGLIVLDEEHETSYKQDKSPHYHARDVALQYAALADATVILGSATPSLESMWRAKRGEYRLLELKERIATEVPSPKSQVQDQRFVKDFAEGEAYANRNSQIALSNVQRPTSNIQLPPVEIVDMRAELKAGNTSIFSRALRDALTATLAAREQAILFLNRRGTATFVMCRDCGYVLKCKRCDNPLTFHADQNELVCHHCGRRYEQPAQCPNCLSRRIKQFGAGTQKVEETVKQLFPTARTLRWDRDVTGTKGAHDAILKTFVAHEADVLIGTQMIAKGLDLPLVTLVGVVSADTALHLPDFRASERTFQLLTQVAGRAGRSRLLGKAIFQTYTPTHPAIVAAAQHDYEKFYDEEIAFRQRLNYPPFSHLVRLLYVGKGEARAQQEAESLQRNLEQRIRQRGLADTELIGPAPCFVHKLRGEYRWQIIVKGQQPHELLEGFVLPLGWRVDVDPMSVL